MQATEVRRCSRTAFPPVSAEGVLRFWKASGAPQRGREHWMQSSRETPGDPPLPRPIILAVLLLPLGRALLGRKASGPRLSQSTHVCSRENPESSPSSLLGIQSTLAITRSLASLEEGRNNFSHQSPIPSTGFILLPALSQEGCGGWGSSGAPEFGTHTYQAWNLLGMAVAGEAKWGQS